MNDSFGTDTPATGGVALAYHGDIVEVVLSRPEVHNALNLAMWQRLEVMFLQLADDGRARAVILRGAGGRAFSAGADVTEFRAERVGDKAAAYNDQLARSLEAIASIPQPTIAMISGLAVGGGCEIAAVCDLRFADERARFGIPINRLGVTLGLVEARALLSLIGPAWTKDLLLTGRLIDASEAFRMGLVNRIIPANKLVEETWSVATRIAAGAPLTAAVNKLTINSLIAGLTPEAVAQIDALTTQAYSGPDLIEGIDAFGEKREPIFVGRAAVEKGACNGERT